MHIIRMRITKMELTTIILYILFTIFTITYYYHNKHRRIIKNFTDNGILYMGSLTMTFVKMVLTGESFADSTIDRYKRVKQSKQKFGIEMEFGNPSFLIADLDLVKQIAVKDFDYFSDPRKAGSPSEKSHDLVGRMVFDVGGTKWKKIRSQLTPVFSTTRSRTMSVIMNSSTNAWIRYLKKSITGHGTEINLHSGLSKLTIDFISTAMFGWDTKVFEMESRNLLESTVSRILVGSFTSFLKITVVAYCPAIADLLGLSVFDHKAQYFFRVMIAKTLSDREGSVRVGKNRRDDFIDLMLDGHRDSDPKSELIEDTAAHAMMFFLGGFDTIRNAIEFAAYNIAISPHVQERVFQEMQGAMAENESELNHELINGLQYLDQVIKETLRLYPILPAQMKKCTKDYCIPETSMVIPCGATILIPFYGIQRDPDYFPDPDTFDPERFSPENKSNIHPTSYIPFGLGPRTCIASRIAQIAMKTAIAHLVWNFEINPSNKTPIPMKIHERSVTLESKSAIWLKLSARQ